MSEPNKELLLPEGTVATECFLIKGNQVLLGLKKRGFAAGKLLGPGGKTQNNETSEQCAIRETEEEIGVKLVNPKKVGHINFFYWENDQQTSQQVDFYLADEWSGEPKETDEFIPKWFQKDQIPLDQLPAANCVFVPQLVSGKQVSGNLVFDKQWNVVSNQLTIEK